MRVFLLDGVRLLDAARIAIQSIDPWAAEVYCSIEDYIYEELRGERTKFLVPRRSSFTFEEMDPADYVMRSATIIPDRHIPPGELHLPIPTPATERY